MGCDLTKNAVVVVAPEKAEESKAEFSDTQIDTIRSTWPLLAHDIARVGMEVFTRIFRETPSVRSLFDSFGICDTENLKYHQLFIEHTQKFMYVLEALVDNLERPEVIRPSLVALGARHAAVEGYHPEYFRFYKKCMLEVWEMELGEEFIAEVRDSWTRVIEYIVQCMSHGYHISITDQLEAFVDKEVNMEDIITEKT
ncbi:cytoglobin-2 [Plakobranchus ocellatus]|uniref:Globin n=1 Tax=Plakobranchus ocellatus TaxID=259542 RepID=A0AAV3ZGP8_9GAST|nr:cytoglobin-2 [Plakobranchus ocellatus]